MSYLQNIPFTAQDGGHFHHYYYQRPDYPLPNEGVRF
jgi:hypothetical protein